MKLARTTTFLSIGMVLLTLAGCEKQGPAEQAGEQIDEAVDTMQGTAEDAGDKAMEKLEQAGDKIEDATDSAAKGG